MSWIKNIQSRIEKFEATVPQQEGEIPVSIKIRVDTGCYHRSCCPYAYQIIDLKVRELKSNSNRFIFEEHETGPEIIVYLAVTAAGLNLAANVINLITTIIKARFEGQKHGDRHHDPVTLIIRRIKNQDVLLEEKLMTFDPHDEVTLKIVEKALLEGFEKIAPPKE